MKAMTLKVGHTYLTRMGTRVKIVEQVDKAYPFVGSNLMHYTSDGRFNISRKSSLDLVAEEVELEREKYIHIHKCSSPSMWYASKVGCGMAVHRELKDEYLCRDDAGFLNIVKKTDAVPVRFGFLGKCKKEGEK